jgi:hypothetical protein
MIVPKENFVQGEFRVLATTDKGQDIASEKHLHNTNTSIKFYKLDLVFNLPLLKVSLNGDELKILNPFYVPHAKQPWS